MSELELSTEVCPCSFHGTKSRLPQVQTISQTVPPYIPKEITDIIISLFPTDNPVNSYGPLCNCALVCRDWLPASRHHIFVNVWLRSDRQYNLFVSNVIRSPTVSFWLPSTRRIVLFPLTHSYKTPTDDMKMHVASSLFMHQLGGKFPNLEQLQLINLDWGISGRSISPRMFIVLSAFASVRTLSLKRVRFPSSGTMRCAITALPSLNDLEMDGVTWPVSRSNRPLRGTRKSQFLRRLRRFRLGHLDFPLEEEMLGWLSVTSLGTSLVDLDIRSTALRNASEIWELAGPSITRLVTSFWPDRGEFPGDSTLH